MYNKHPVFTVIIAQTVHISFLRDKPNLLSRVVGGSSDCWSLGSWQEQLSNCWMIPGLIFSKSSLEMDESLFCRNISTSCPAEKQVCVEETYIVTKLSTEIHHPLAFLRSQNYTKWRKLTHEALTIALKTFLHMQFLWTIFNL